MTNFLVRYCNVQKANDSCNGILITRGVQEYEINIIYPLHVTVFDALLDNDKKEADTAGE